MSFTKVSKDKLQKMAATIIIKVRNEGADPNQEISSCGLHSNLQEQLGHMVNVGTFLDKFKDTLGDDRDISFPLVDTEQFIGDQEEPLGPTNPVKGVVKKKVTVTKKDKGPLPNLEEPVKNEPSPEEDLEEPKEIKEASVTTVSISREKLAAAVAKLEQEQYNLAYDYLGGIEKLSSLCRRDNKITSDVFEYTTNEVVLNDIVKTAKIERPVTSSNKFKIKPETEYIKLAESLSFILDNINEIADSLDYLESL